MDSVILDKSPSGVSIDVGSYNNDESPSFINLTSASDSDEGSSFTSYFKHLTLYRIGLIIIVLLFLGINILSYLGNSLDSIKKYLSPAMKNILVTMGVLTADVVKDTATAAANVTKLGVDVAAGTVQSAADVLEGQLEPKSGSQKKMDVTINNPDGSNKKSLEATLSGILSDVESKIIPEPDDATSKTQSSKSKSGYCYIGEDRGFRSCIKISESDKCMSGDIFPTKQICINPSLRE
jgi:hypothetical protein